MADPQSADIRLLEAAMVVCDGGDPSLGHPRVSLSLEKTGEVTCPWCGGRYRRNLDAPPHGHS